LQAGDSFVIVACDGLWDELTNHEAVTRCANYLRLAADESERGGAAQHLIDYALDKAAQRLQRQEPDLGVKNRHDLLKIPPGRDGRKYLHDDITVVVVILGTDGSRYPSGISKATNAADPPRARARWGEIKKSVDLIKMMKGKESSQAGKVRHLDAAGVRSDIESFVCSCTRPRRFNSRKTLDVCRSGTRLSTSSRTCELKTDQLLNNTDQY
jgi:hypothetical protein